MPVFEPDAELALAERSRQLHDAVDAPPRNEDDAVANMANVASLVREFAPDLNRAGFDRLLRRENGSDELVLGALYGSSRL